MARYNLSLNDNYTLVDSFCTGGMENACVCDNCNKMITNVATITNDAKKVFNVGLDCASTLTNLNGLYNVECEFAEMKALIAKANKAKKESELKFSILTSGKLLCENSKGWIFTASHKFSVKYLPQYLKLVTNPEKIGYTEKNIDINLAFDKFIPSQNKDFKHVQTFNDFECIISVKPYFHMVTKEISGYDFWLDIPSLKVSERVCMYSQIASKIKYEINRFYFNQFNNH